jgi:hypothetical protein
MLRELIILLFSVCLLCLLMNRKNRDTQIKLSLAYFLGATVALLIK